MINLFQKLQRRGYRSIDNILISQQNKMRNKFAQTSRNKLYPAYKSIDCILNF